jgi:hypothetical protein
MENESLRRRLSLQPPEALLEALLIIRRRMAASAAARVSAADRRSATSAATRTARTSARRLVVVIVTLVVARLLRSAGEECGRLVLLRCRLDFLPEAIDAARQGGHATGELEAVLIRNLLHQIWAESKPRTTRLQLPKQHSEIAGKQNGLSNSLSTWDSGIA